MREQRGRGERGGGEEQREHGVRVPGCRRRVGAESRPTDVDQEEEDRCTDEEREHGWPRLPGCAVRPHDPDREQHQDDRTDAGEPRHAVDRSHQAPPHELGRLLQRGAQRLLLDGAGVPSPARVPEQVDGGRGRDDQRRRLPPAAQQRRDPDDDGHGEAHAGERQREHEHEARPRIAPSERSVVRRDEQREQAEHDRHDERDLERVDQVFPSGAEHHEDRGRAGGEEPVDAVAHHQAPQQVGGEQVGDDEHDEVRRVGADPEHREERPVDQDGERAPVLVVGLEESELTVPEHAPPNEEVPLVAAEPLVPIDPQQQRERDRE